MINKEKAREIAEYYTDTNDIGVALNSAKEMAEWKDHSPSDELIEKICKLCDMFDKDAPWQSACWCEHAEEDDWSAVYSRRIQFIKSKIAK